MTAPKKLQESQLQELQDMLGKDHVLTSQIDLIPYERDGTAGLHQSPLAVVLPASTEEAAQVVTWCAKQSPLIPIVTRGSGTGLSGGSVPSPGSLVLCLSRMNQIVHVDTGNLTLHAQAGVITQDIALEAEKHGLFYPPDPGSMKISTIGGNIAENSGGLRGLKYGVTRDYIMAIRVILSDGSITWLGSSCVKDVAGFSLKDLFIGSEGSFGIVTEAILKLLPKPAARATLLATFPTLESAAQTVSDIIAQKIIPCTLEFLDQVTLRCVEDYAHVGLPSDAVAVLLMETDGHPAAVDEEAASMEAIARAQHAIQVTRAANEEESIRLAAARRNAFSALARVKPTTILEDVTVPRTHLAEMVRAIREIAEKHQLNVGVFGHMGDGNLHPTFLTDERHPEEMHRIEQALDEIVDKTLALGGTITGEHGVGLAKKRWLAQQLGSKATELTRQFKQTLDPHSLFNPGKVIDV